MGAFQYILIYIFFKFYSSKNTRVELNKEKEMSLQEKARLKETIKKFESDFNKANNRSLNKEDREFHKEDFERYKVRVFTFSFVL